MTHSLPKLFGFQDTAGTRAVTAPAKAFAEGDFSQAVVLCTLERSKPKIYFCRSLVNDFLERSKKLC
jgi:hypothetical protein